jgi:hypothetical protein
VHGFEINRIKRRGLRVYKCGSGLEPDTGSYEEGNVPSRPRESTEFLGELIYY